MRNLIAFGLTGFLPSGAEVQAAPRPNQEQQLVRILQGRVAGTPVDCVNPQSMRSTQIIDGTAIIYNAGSTIYVNRPRDAGSLRHWDTFVTMLHLSQFCSIDVGLALRKSSRTWTGSAFLGDVVPYKRVRQNYRKVALTTTQPKTLQYARCAFPLIGCAVTPPSKGAKA